nr:hypothetical protein [Rhodoferax sp.]
MPDGEDLARRCYGGSDLEEGVDAFVVPTAESLARLRQACHVLPGAAVQSGPVRAAFQATPSR